MMPPPRTRLFALAWVPALLLAAGPAPGTKEPSKLDGAWTWSWKDPKGETHRHVLEVGGVETTLAARERQDELPPVAVKDLTFAGKKVHFSVVCGEKRAEYTGALGDPDPDTISGKVSVTWEGQTSDYLWWATRQKPSE